ncbi:hypothetical protein, conserved in T. vivax [Trypanosoma vivax Y486]|uniref:Uncharacterized protein n=1 Tax=Trypanosoma vivax (strain Y486) TaxID=1055687 RepID=F9WS65_TRYVY|nr:hypothetical protein, conserved in T. vivax [Trypanosoma vivax Y486]|eukprot:CCD20403.1 hypothetical protein, conserved in T. vivax [Trypanosoma vivax Y486]
MHLKALCFVLVLLYPLGYATTSPVEDNGQITCTFSEGAWNCSKDAKRLCEKTKVRDSVNANMGFRSNCDTAICNSTCGSCNCTQWGQYFYRPSAHSAKGDWAPSIIKGANCTRINTLQPECQMALCAMIPTSDMGTHKLGECKNCTCISPSQPAAVVSSSVQAPAAEPTTENSQSLPISVGSSGHSSSDAAEGQASGVAPPVSDPARPPRDGEPAGSAGTQGDHTSSSVTASAVGENKRQSSADDRAQPSNANVQKTQAESNQPISPSNSSVAHVARWAHITFLSAMPAISL